MVEQLTNTTQGTEADTDDISNGTGVWLVLLVCLVQVLGDTYPPPRSLRCSAASESGFSVDFVAGSMTFYQLSQPKENQHVFRLDILLVLQAPSSPIAALRSRCALVTPRQPGRAFQYRSRSCCCVAKRPRTIRTRQYSLSQGKYLLLGWMPSSIRSTS